MGPPTRPPKRLSCNGGFGSGRPVTALTVWLRVHVLGFKTLFCRYSYGAPCQVVLRRRVTICTSPPAEREKLAPELVVTTRNSSRLSIGVGTTARGVAVKFLPLSLPLPPRSLVAVPPPGPECVISVPAPPSFSPRSSPL